MIDEIYKEAEKFTENHFPNLNPNNRRITILAVMKDLITLKQLEMLTAIKKQ